MEQATVEPRAQFVNLALQDWQGTRQVHLDDVPRNATVAEVLDEARRMMDLPLDTNYQAVREGRALNNMETLEDVGINADASLEIHPDVSAGASCPVGN